MPRPITLHLFFFHFFFFCRSGLLPSLMQIHAGRTQTHGLRADAVGSLFLSPLLQTCMLSSRGREGKGSWCCWAQGASKGSGHQSRARRGQNVVSGGDLSSNCSSGATLGLISEVLKVGLCVCVCVWTIPTSLRSFSVTILTQRKLQ